PPSASPRCAARGSVHAGRLCRPTISRRRVRPSCEPRSLPRADRLSAVTTACGLAFVNVACFECAGMPHRHCAGAVAHAIFGPAAPSYSKSMRHTVRKVLLGILILFLLPLAVHAALYAGRAGPAGSRAADWWSVGWLPPAAAARDARFLVFPGRTGRWKGIFAVHSWVVFKPENATSWSRYDVVGWGQPLRTNGWAPD